MLQVLLLLLFSLLPSLTHGLDITGSITPNRFLLSSALLPPSTLLTLSSPNLEYTTHPSPSGSFSFRNVTVGPSYILQVECLTNTFSPLRIDTQNEDVEVYQTFSANEWSHRGAKLSYPIQLFASSQADYYMVYFASQGGLIPSLDLDLELIHYLRVQWFYLQCSRWL